MEGVVTTLIMGTTWTAAVNAVTGGMTDIVDTITGNSIMLLAVAIPFVGAMIGLAKSLLRFGGRRG